ncbi:MAG: ankyrin repeat domain-containing protein [Gammaproteobacteria bacterium]|nr:ankyrin repeat domain-containing protein [Gammaproteobacteria bacterium]MDE0247280.1 ankyrin repeat domain-containing protein [Gammaproteobacteria bacterium]
MTRAAGARSLFVLGLAAILCAARVQEPGIAGAAKAADWDLVRALLRESPDTDDVLGDGTTALIWASYWENPEIVELLIAADADVNAASDLGVTALWPAAEHGSLAIAGILLDAGADPDAALLSGETPVMTAARGGHVEVVELLLARGADPNTRATREHTALMWAAAGRHPEVVEALLAGGADVHARSGSWAQYYQKGGGSSPHPDDEFWVQEGGFTPLLFAARAGDLASARLLVAAGADVNDRTAGGMSATTVAVHAVAPRAGLVPVPGEFQGGGAVLPAGAAFASPHALPPSDAEELVEFLLEEGADPNADEYGHAAIHAAILRRSERAVRTLLAHGADPNATLRSAMNYQRDSYDFYFDLPLEGASEGARPFWLAARFGQPNVMRLLADAGADPLWSLYVEHWGAGNRTAGWTTRTEGTTTALMAALGMPRVVGFAQPNDPAEREADTLEAVRIAVALGIDVNAANADGATALDAARRLGYQSVTDFLIENGAVGGEEARSR